MSAPAPPHADRPFRVLVTCGSFEPGFRGGGPVRSVARIIDTASIGTDVALVTRDRDLGSPDPYPGLSGRWKSRRAAQVFYLDTRRPRQWLGLFRELRARPFDLLYANSLWSPVFTIIPLLAARLGLIRAEEVLLAPRGELSPGALSLKVHKKRLFFTLWRPVLNGLAVTWHASSELERDHIAGFFPAAKVIVDGNQSALPADPLPPGPSNDDRARLVFISRISPKKNLAMVIAALQGSVTPIELDIFGPIGDEGYWRSCLRAMSSLPNHARVQYRGELQPDEVRHAFSEYDAFVFPTLGENFGHVIAESLSSSCPVICSEHTPWNSVLRDGGGSVLSELSAGCLGSTLNAVASRSAADRLRDRVKAGEAYRSWHLRRTVGPHIFDAVQEIGCSSPKRCSGGGT